LENLGDNGLLASGSEDKTIKIWDTKSEIYFLVTTLLDHTDTIYCLKQLNKTHFASGSLDTTIKIWDLTYFRSVATYRDHSSAVRALALLKINYLASGSYDQTIKIWNTNDGSLIKTLPGHNHVIYGLTVLPNGYLASCSFFRDIKIWDIDSGENIFKHIMYLSFFEKKYLIKGELIRNITGHTLGVTSLAVLNNGYLFGFDKENLN
jgi:WD40 repeat protein